MCVCLFPNSNFSQNLRSHPPTSPIVLSLSLSYFNSNSLILATVSLFNCKGAWEDLTVSINLRRSLIVNSWVSLISLQWWIIFLISLLVCVTKILDNFDKFQWGKNFNSFIVIVLSTTPSFHYKIYNPIYQTKNVHKQPHATI